jgi:hypothetical protein
MDFLMLALYSFERPKLAITEFKKKRFDEKFKILFHPHVNSESKKLDSQLNTALQFVEHNLKSGACGHLNGFVIQVLAALQIGHITQIQATQLIQAAQNIQTALGCTLADRTL